MRLLKVSTRCSTTPVEVFHKAQKAHNRLVNMEQKKRIQMKACIDQLTSHVREDMKEVMVIVNDLREETITPEAEIVDDDYFK